MSMMAVTVPGRCHGRADRSWRGGRGPRCGRSLRRISRDPSGQELRSIMPVPRRPTRPRAGRRLRWPGASTDRRSGPPWPGSAHRRGTRKKLNARLIVASKSIPQLFRGIGRGPGGPGPLPRGGPRFPVAQHLNPGHRIRPVGDRHCQVGKHLPRQMQREPAVGVQQRPGHRLGRPRSRRQFPQQRGPGVRHHATPVRADLDPRPAAATQGTFPHLRPVSAYRAAQPPADS